MQLTLNAEQIKHLTVIFVKFISMFYFNFVSYASCGTMQNISEL